jgi:hypothetical protein
MGGLYYHIICHFGAWLPGLLGWVYSDIAQRNPVPLSATSHRLSMPPGYTAGDEGWAITGMALEALFLPNICCLQDTTGNARCGRCGDFCAEPEQP